ncbi:MAG TPA: GNAT family N-acetyltransferase [Candidatus Dormibacteraeota bacterium]
MRPGREGDLYGLMELMRTEVLEGRQDIVPSEGLLRRVLQRFDWETRSRVIEDGGRIAGSALVMSRPSPDGVIATVYAAGRGDRFRDMARWGVQFSRAAGAAIVQSTVAKGHGGSLADAGMKVVRPWWRMDRTLSDGLPEATPVHGYELIDGAGVAPGVWSEMFNRTFLDHWRFVPRAEGEIIAGKQPELSLMAVTATGGSPAAMTLAEVETYPDDPRPQPIGLVSSVGTMPEHRRRGLARWLVAESLHRLREAGARHASLYVDGLSPMRAFDVYEKLGFAVMFEAEVWEAAFP